MLSAALAAQGAGVTASGFQTSLETRKIDVLPVSLRRMITGSGAFVNPGQDTFEVRSVNDSATLHRPPLTKHLGDAQESC